MKTKKTTLTKEQLASLAKFKKNFSIKQVEEHLEFLFAGFLLRGNALTYTPQEAEAFFALTNKLRKAMNFMYQHEKLPENFTGRFDVLESQEGLRQLFTAYSSSTIFGDCAPGDNADTLLFVCNLVDLLEQVKPVSFN